MLKNQNAPVSQKNKFGLMFFSISRLKCEVVIVILNDGTMMALKYLYACNSDICISNKFLMAFLFSIYALWMILIYIGWQWSTRLLFREIDFYLLL